MEPWHNDYVLSDHQAAEIIAQDVPDLTVSGACYFAEGWDFTVFAIDTAATTWLFRFPKRKECARRLEAEYKVVDQLVPALVDTGIRVPDFHYRIEKSKAFALPYGGYELLEGRPLLECPARSLDIIAIGARLGPTLDCIHQSKPWPAPRLFRDQFPSYVVDFRRELDELSQALPSHLVAAMQRLMAHPEPAFEGQPTFKHADLGTEHILIDGSGIPTAIIDWGDAGWGDPRGDLVGLWAWGGDAVVAATLDSMHLRLDDADWARLRYRGACICVGQAYYGHRSQRPALLDTAVNWLNRMCDAGQLADVRAPDG